MTLLNDPGPFGWAATAGYFAAAWLSGAAARSAPKAGHADRIGARFWAGTALLMLLLAVNKQLDLQTTFTDWMRAWARSGGWYDDRRAYQLLFLEIMAVSGLLAALWLLRAVRTRHAADRAGVFGVILTIAFVALRAASFYHHDMLGSATVLGAETHDVLELCCILWVGTAAWLRFKGAGSARHL